MYPALSPFKINCNVTLRLHSPDFSVLPFIRKCRKQQDMPFPALDKHLCNCSCKAKIPIDLERRVCTQHVGINAASHTGDIFLPGITELVFQKPQCMFPVPESGPEACFPCHTPSGSFVPAPFQSHPAGFQKLRGFFCNQVSGIKTIQMGNMAVMDLCFRIIQEPFPDRCHTESVY